MIRTLDRHPCGRRHRDPAVFARCHWRGARITGTGRFAVVTRCDGVSIALFERLAPARTHVAELAVFGCCRTCHRDHELVGIDTDASTTSEPAGSA